MYEMLEHNIKITKTDFLFACNWYDVQMHAGCINSYPSFFRTWIYGIILLILESFS